MLVEWLEQLVTVIWLEARRARRASVGVGGRESERTVHGDSGWRCETRSKEAVGWGHCVHEKSDCGDGHAKYWLTESVEALVDRVEKEAVAAEGDDDV